MTTPDYRAALASLIESVRYLSECWRDPENGVDPVCLAEAETQMREARALLAAPEAVGPTDEELMDLWLDGINTSEARGAFAFAHAVLARWGRPAIKPVPLSERLPGPGDCDADVRCWLCGNVEGDWRLIDASYTVVPQLKYCFSHWLPAHALPVPGVTP